MQGSTHRRDNSQSRIEIRTDFSREFLPGSHSKGQSLDASAPLRGILKKSPTAANSQRVERSYNPSPMASLPTSPEANGNGGIYVEKAVAASYSPRCSPKTRYSQQSGEESLPEEDTADESLKAQLRKAAEVIRNEQQLAQRSKDLERLRLRREVLAVVTEAEARERDRDESLVVLESASSSGSETERPEVRNNHGAIRQALQWLLASPQQRADLYTIVEACGTPRLSLLVRKNEVKAMYEQNTAGWRKVYGGKDTPQQVEYASIQCGFEFLGRQLHPLHLSQLWRADAFSL